MLWEVPRLEAVWLPVSLSCCAEAAPAAAGGELCLASMGVLVAASMGEDDAALSEGCLSSLPCASIALSSFRSPLDSSSSIKFASCSGTRASYCALRVQASVALSIQTKRV